MKLRFNRAHLSILIIALVLIIDQVIKFSVKLSMYKHESIKVFDWFYIYFTENIGMAFGMELIGKLFLSIFRIVLVAFIGYYLYKIIHKKRFPTGYIVCISFILAGAAGNIIDSVFYGEIFTDSVGRVAQLVPWGEGYSSLFYGQVVDMFYFPLFEFDWPQWMPFCGGEHFIFFSPIFNFADACISCSIIVLLFFYSKYLNLGFNKQKVTSDEVEKK